MPDDVKVEDIPIVVMSFNRPDYLKDVLESLIAQQGASLSSRRIIVFQDNAVNAYSGTRYAEDVDIGLAIDVVKAMLPQAEIKLAENNIGVCENFLRAERYVFQELKADVAYFFEDDMILSPHYLFEMDLIAGFALRSGRIGYFSAGGIHNQSLARQRMSAKTFRRLGHHWAFGLVRPHWEELDRWLAPYYELVVGTDYRKRPTPTILKRFRDKGAPLCVSSQDDAKKTGTYMLNRASITTGAVFARYIGEKGLHMTEKLFESRGYANTVLYPEPIDDFQFPGNDEIDAFIRDELEQRRAEIVRQRQKK